MFSVFLCIVLSGFSSSGSDTSTSTTTSLSQSGQFYNIYQTLGVSVCYDYLHVNDINYTGFSISGFFRPVTCTEVGIVYRQLSGNNKRYPYSTFYVALQSPKFWRIEATGGVAFNHDFTTYPENGYGDLPASLRGGLHTFAGLDVVLKENPEGFQYNLRSRMYFKDYSPGRISIGCYLLK